MQQLDSQVAKVLQTVIQDHKVLQGSLDHKDYREYLDLLDRLVPLDLLGRLVLVGLRDLKAYRV